MKKERPVAWHNVDAFELSLSNSPTLLDVRPLPALRVRAASRQPPAASVPLCLSTVVWHER